MTPCWHTTSREGPQIKRGVGVSEGLRARKTAIISRLLMSRLDQEPNARLPLHRTPQPELEASVIITFLLEVSLNTMPVWYRWGAFQRATAETQQWSLNRQKCPRCQVWDGTLTFSQYCRGRIWSRPSNITGNAASIRPRILWNVLRGRKATILKTLLTAEFSVSVLMRARPASGLSR